MMLSASYPIAPFPCVPCHTVCNIKANNPERAPTEQALNFLDIHHIDIRKKGAGKPADLSLTQHANAPPRLQKHSTEKACKLPSK